MLIGDEQYLIDEIIKTISSSFSENTKLIIYSYMDLVNQLSSYSLFNTLVVYKGALKDINTDFIENYICCDTDKNCDLIIVPESFDKNLKIYKVLDRNNCIKACNKLNEQEYMVFLEKYINKKNKCIPADVLKTLIKQTSYLDTDDVTLNMVVNDLDNLLSVCGQQISKEEVELYVKKQEVENVFNLINLIKAQDLKSLLAQADIILSKNISIMRTLGLLMRTYRIMYKAYILNASKAEINISYVPASFKNKETIISGIKIILDTKNGIKAGTLTEHQAFKICLMKLCSANNYNY